MSTLEAVLHTWNLPYPPPHSLPRFHPPSHFFPLPSHAYAVLTLLVKAFSAFDFLLCFVSFDMYCCFFHPLTPVCILKQRKKKHKRTKKGETRMMKRGGVCPRYIHCGEIKSNE